MAGSDRFDADDFMKKYGGGALPQPTERAAPSAAPAGNGSGAAYNGMYLLLLANIALFVVDHMLHLKMSWLYLNHAAPKWYQFITHMFCHGGWNHLSGNMFFLYVFGKEIEEQEGSAALAAAYIFSGLGAAVASLLLLPKYVGGGFMGGSPVVSLGASGAVFGLYVVGVGMKLARFSFRNLVASVILGQFVINRLINEVKMQTFHGTMRSGVSHVAHLGGALAGVLLMYVVYRLSRPKK